MGFLHNVDDVGAANEARGEEKQHDDHIGREQQGKQIRLRIKAKRHFLRIHKEQAEAAPDEPRKRCAQHRARSARAERDQRKFAAQLVPELPARCAQCKENTGFA